MKKVIVMLMLLSAWQAVLAADTSMKSAKLDLSKLPQKVLLIEPEIAVNEVSVGGVPERVEDWSKQGKSNVLKALDQQVTSKHIFETMTLPSDLAEDQLTGLEEHVALYNVVGFNAFYFGRSQFDAWKHKQKEFDYTLGTGLKTLAEQTGADAALIIIGEDYISSGGRKAARLFAALLGVIVPGSPTFLSAALVDLKSGDILWMNYGLAIDSKDLRKQEDVDKLMGELFAYYPGRTVTP